MHLRFHRLAKTRPTVLGLCALSALTLAACNNSKPPAAPASATAKAAAAAPTDQPATLAAGGNPGGQAGATPASAPNGEPAARTAGAKAAAAEHLRPQPTHDAARRVAASGPPAADPSSTYRAPEGPRTYSVEYRTCLASANSFTAARADCYSAELARQGARLTHAYESLLAARSGDARTQLQQAQSAWIQERDSQCQEETAAGARDILHEGSCRLDMTIRRAGELEHMAG
jgi:uncharacterized protein YecT (DUF1311 family)